MAHIDTKFDWLPSLVAKEVQTSIDEYIKELERATLQHVMRAPPLGSGAVRSAAEDVEFREEQHPRGGKGSGKGGQFVKKGIGGGRSEREPEQQARKVGPGKTRRTERARADIAGRAEGEPEPYTRTGGEGTGSSGPLREAWIVGTWRRKGSPTYFELGGLGLDHAASVAVFRESLEAAKKANPGGAAVELYSASEYRRMRIFLTGDGSAGFAVKGDNIVSVFKHPDSPHKHVAASMLQLAVQNGGRRLDCYDTVLPHIYGQAGFRAVARIKWNDEHAPPDWDKGKFKIWNGGEPDVVFMVYDPDHAKPYIPGEGWPYRDWIDAEVQQRNIVALVHRDQIISVARKTAAKVDFDPDYVLMTYREEQFTLDDRTYNYAGSYTPGAAAVVLYSKQLSPESVAGIAAHEIAHRKFDALGQRYRQEYAAVMNESMEQHRGPIDPVMKPDGTLKPPYDAKYPVYDAYTRITGDFNQMVKDDGVTPYSREWWQAWHNRDALTWQAFTETVAEMGWLKQQQGNLGGASPQWQALFELTESNWASMSKEEREKVHSEAGW